MRSVFVVVLLALLSSGVAEEPSSSDGRMWANLGTTPQGMVVKAAYVRGAMEAFRAAAYVGYLDGRMDEKNEALDYVSQCLKGPCAGVPVASMIKDFDYKNTPICMIQAVQEATASLDGKSSTEEQLDMMRKAGPCH